MISAPFFCFGMPILFTQPGFWYTMRYVLSSHRPYDLSSKGAYP